MSNISQRANFEDERARSAPFSGSYQTLGGILTAMPVIMIIDNQSDGDVGFSVNGTSTWKTFSAGQALLLDLRANHGIASNFTVDVGTQLYVKATAGTSGAFRVSILSAR